MLGTALQSIINKGKREKKEEEKKEKRVLCNIDILYVDYACFLEILHCYFIVSFFAIF
jgi:hypothetical protein